ncbi:methyltransferase [Streptosporangium sp. CA-115845]|uniref:methyltransferase n=1 Tax=Streptosporangium sp. CA-115845 TaxID=3240071 RepID=UPI003D9030C2
MIQRVINRYWMACGVRAFIRLGVPDALAGGGLSLRHLAEQCDAHPDFLARLLRALAPHALVAADATTNQWWLPPVGETLITGRRGALEAVIERWESPAYEHDLRVLPELLTSAVTTRPGLLLDLLSPPAANSASATEMSDPQRSIADLLTAFGDLAALRVAAEHRWADKLRDGALSAADLAERTGVHPDPVREIADRLRTLDVLTSPVDDHYELTAAGQTLRYDRPDSMRPALQMCGHPVWWGAMWHLDTVVGTGQPYLAPGTSAYDVIGGDPVAQSVFDRFMTCRSAPIAEALRIWAATAAIEPGSVIVDVGGGRGTLLAALLEELPGCRGVLLERSVVLPAARTYLADHQMSGRCEVVGGDFFAQVPSGDVHLLGSVLHNWSDKDAVAILNGIRGATTGTGRLVIVEYVLPNGPEPHSGYGMDLRGMGLFAGGRERTAAEFTTLLTEAGFTLLAACSLPHGLTRMIAVPTAA